MSGTFDRLATHYAAAFPASRPWSSGEIETLVTRPGGFLTQTAHGFAIGHVVLDEAELLTLLVHPTHRTQGHSPALLSQWESHAATHGATRAFLEVAATNAPALALYTGQGWQITGQRSRYYRSGANAVLMAKSLSS